MGATGYQPRAAEATVLHRVAVEVPLEGERKQVTVLFADRAAVQADGKAIQDHATERESRKREAS